MSNGKLVRDKIPQIIKETGRIPVTHTASDDEFKQKLKEKLLDEAQEYCDSESEEELADIIEVVYAICECKKFKKASLEVLRNKKLKERGAFHDHIILEAMHSPD